MKDPVRYQRHALTDAEVLAGFMEPRPEMLSCGTYKHSPGGWWEPDQDNWWAFMPRVVRLDPQSTECLHWLREIEARLTDEQWDQYQWELWGVWSKQSGRWKELCLAQILIHLSAEEKLAALAAVLAKEKA